MAFLLPGKKSLQATSDRPPAIFDELSRNFYEAQKKMIR